MLKQYSILNRCLSELKKSGMPAMEKLKLEVELIRMKRILLDHEVEHLVRGVTASGIEFNDLFDLIQYACSSQNTGGEIIRVTMHIQEIKEGIKTNIHILHKPNKNRLKRFLAQLCMDIINFNCF